MTTDFYTKGTETILDVDIETAFDDFRLTAAFTAGQGVTALFGPSGAGKTSLINAIAGLSTPDRGIISVNGKTLFDSAQNINLPPEQRAVGYVFQDARLFPHYSVEQNLMFGQRFRNAGNIGLAEIVELLGIEHLLTRQPNNLSGGEKQRVAIGRALLASPDILLMDEPLASLDAGRRKDVLPYIEKLRDEFEIPTIYVSHQVPEIMRLADTVVVLENGRVYGQGLAEEILNRQDIQERLEPDADAPDNRSRTTILTASIKTSLTSDGLTILSLGDDDLLVPNLAGREAHRVRLSIRAKDVALATERPANLSVLNCLEGQVAEIVPVGQSHMDVHVRLNSGHSLWASVTARSCKQLALEPDKMIWALIKSVAIEDGVMSFKSKGA